jgi:hypothetical protein
MRGGQLDVHAIEKTIKHVLWTTTTPSIGARSLAICTIWSNYDWTAAITIGARLETADRQDLNFQNVFTYKKITKYIRCAVSATASFTWGFASEEKKRKRSELFYRQRDVKYNLLWAATTTSLGTRHHASDSNLVSPRRQIVHKTSRYVPRTNWSGTTKLTAIAGLGSTNNVISPNPTYV